MSASMGGASTSLVLWLCHGMQVCDSNVSNLMLDFQTQLSTEHSSDSSASERDRGQRRNGQELCCGWIVSLW